MAEHAHTTSTTLARRRHTRAVPGPADRRRASLLQHPVTPAQRARIERDVDLLIGLLDALDAAGQDFEEDNEDCCDAADDDPASSQAVVPGAGSAWGPGDPDDGESTPEDEGEITPEDEGEPTDDDIPFRCGVESDGRGLHPFFLTRKAGT